MLPKLTLIIGAAASGKSAFAERLVTSSMRARSYIATAQAFDDEMRAKIARHKDMRGSGWTTIEAPLDIPAALQQVPADHAVLIDCATLWLTNHMLAKTDLEQAESDLLKALENCPVPVVIVSNEVGAGVVPDNALSRKFREAQGRLNQHLAAQADLAVTVIAGLPMVLKGTLPQALE
ncbi:bifunctional adenosylcobinamide kinase/adenosylcobinamide-phosphate guanylyltransferase [Profundibacter sp.]|uniref:bifunctional adenosylcobinamide kinase/adenosylcobinamide-phosphate guanylyltransferase n=1 Tax=Profundibacter sp. TaxID=3101071 RepID=UPI003D122541